MASLAPTACKSSCVLCQGSEQQGDGFRPTRFLGKPNCLWTERGSPCGTLDLSSCCSPGSPSTRDSPRAPVFRSESEPAESVYNDSRIAQTTGKAPGRARARCGEGIVCLNDGHVTGVVTSPPCQVGAGAAKGEDVSGLQWGPLAKLWLGLRPPRRPSSLRRRVPGSWSGPLSGPSGEGEGGRSASRGLTPVPSSWERAACHGPASPPHLTAPRPGARSPPTGAEGVSFVTGDALSLISSYPAGEETRVPGESDLLYPVSHCWGLSEPRRLK